MFQHTAARRRLGADDGYKCSISRVSTHSRPKAAGWLDAKAKEENWFQHTAARRRLGGIPPSAYAILTVSTHSRPKAAGEPIATTRDASVVSTHSRPKAAGSTDDRGRAVYRLFQHTAARRRLGVVTSIPVRVGVVSTHSRPKAAGCFETFFDHSARCFNTQPPEGGWRNTSRLPRL